MLPHHYSRHFYRISFSRLQNDRNVICQQFIAVEKHTFCFWRMYNDKMILCCPIAVLCYLFFINFSIYLTKNRKKRIFLKILCKKDNISYFCCNFAADITLLYNNWAHFKKEHILIPVWPVWSFWVKHSNRLRWWISVEKSLWKSRKLLW